MSYQTMRGLGAFGKGPPMPPPEPPPPDIAPTISPEVELDILRQTLPTAQPEPSAMRSYAMPLLVGGSVLLLGTIGLILMLRV